MKKVYTIPEWFSKLKKYKKYDLEKAYLLCDKNSKNELRKITKKEFYTVIKKCRKEKYPLSDSEIEDIMFINENINEYSDSLMDLKISYLDKIYDKENGRQEIIDQKAQTNISQTSLIIGIIGLLGAGGIFDLLKDINIILKILFLLGNIGLIFVFSISIYYSVKTLIPKPYTRPRQNLMRYGIKNNLREQKLGYFVSLYQSITWNQRINTEKNELMGKSQKLFGVGLVFLAFDVILFIIILVFCAKNDNSNIIYIIIKKIKECFLDRIIINNKYA